MSLVDQMLGYAQGELGKPYVYGDEGPNTFDCSGLVQFVFGKVGISTPRTSQEQQAWASPVTQPLPGDLVFYGRPATHVGIYLGNGRMINAPQPGAVVRIDPVGAPTSYGRVPGLGTALAPITGVLGDLGGTVAGWLGGARNIVLEAAGVLAGLALAGGGLYLLTRHGGTNAK